MRGDVCGLPSQASIIIVELITRRYLTCLGKLPDDDVNPSSAGECKHETYFWANTPGRSRKGPNIDDEHEN